MFHVEYPLHDARRRQASLRPSVAHPIAVRRAVPARERLGGWLIRLGHAVAGRPATAPAWQG